VCFCHEKLHDIRHSIFDKSISCTCTGTGRICMLVRHEPHGHQS
jgi:hypothetical protein